MKEINENKTLIIAEAGVNHNGSLEIAKQLVDTAKDCKADMVKFQLFNASLVTTETAGKAPYQKTLDTNDTTQFAMLKKLEISVEDYESLVKYAYSIDMPIFSTAFDLESLDVLKLMGQKVFKVASGEIVNTLMLEKIGSLEKKLFFLLECRTQVTLNMLWEY